jgi:hypothetical protein
VACKLFRLATGSYDDLFNGVIIASLVRMAERMQRPRQPVPFTEMEHSFGSLEDVQNWLGGAELKDPESQD